MRVEASGAEGPVDQVALARMEDRRPEEASGDFFCNKRWAQLVFALFSMDAPDVGLQWCLEEQQWKHCN